MYLNYIVSIDFIKKKFNINFNIFFIKSKFVIVNDFISIFLNSASLSFIIE